MRCQRRRRLLLLPQRPVVVRSQPGAAGCGSQLQCCSALPRAGRARAVESSARGSRAESTGNLSLPLPVSAGSRRSRAISGSPASY